MVTKLQKIIFVYFLLIKYKIYINKKTRDKLQHLNVNCY